MPVGTRTSAFTFGLGDTGHLDGARSTPAPLTPFSRGALTRLLTSRRRRPPRPPTARRLNDGIEE